MHFFWLLYILPYIFVPGIFSLYFFFFIYCDLNEILFCSQKKIVGFGSYGESVTVNFGPKYRYLEGCDPDISIPDSPKGSFSNLTAIVYQSVDILQILCELAKAHGIKKKFNLIFPADCCNYPDNFFRWSSQWSRIIRTIYRVTFLKK